MITRGKKDQILIDKTIHKNCCGILTNLAIVKVDCKKVFDVDPHSWILKCFNMIGTAKNITKLTSNNMANWRAVLTSYGKEIRQVDIKRWIFNGDSISTLLLILIIIPLTLVLRRVKAGYRL